LYEKQLFSGLKQFILYCCGFVIPNIIFLLFFYGIAGYEGIKRYFILNYFMNLFLPIGYSTSFIPILLFNFFHILLYLIGFYVVFFKKKISIKIKLLIILSLINLIIFSYKLRFNGPDFIFMIPFISILAVYGYMELAKKIPRLYKPFFTFLVILLIFIVPFISLVPYQGIITKNVEVIDFYLENHEGEFTNCNLVFTPLYRWNHAWHNRDTLDFLERFNLPSQTPSVQDYINNKYRFICEFNTEFVEEDYKTLLSEKGYIPFALGGTNYKGYYYLPPE